jgi:hypothetical protein
VFAYSSCLLLPNLAPALLCSFGECRITAFKDTLASLRQSRQQVRLSYSNVRKDAGDPVAQLAKVRVLWNE